MPPPVIQPLVQPRSWLCGETALAMYAGRPLAAVLAKKGAAGEQGLTAAELQRLARACGLRLRRRAWDEDEDDLSGLVLVAQGDGSYHWVVAFHGVVIDPADGCVYEGTAFFQDRRAETVLVEADARAHVSGVREGGRRAAHGPGRPQGLPRRRA